MNLDKLVLLQHASLVFIGGGIGATLRFFLSLIAIAVTGRSWPGTLLVNIVGTFVLFRFASVLLDQPSGVFWRIGVLGGLTTFSTFCFEVVDYYKEGHVLLSIAVFALNVISGVMIGIWVLQQKAI